MKSLFTQLMMSGCMLLSGHCLAQTHWPKTIYSPAGGSIRIYKPQVESFAGNIVQCKSTIALLADGDDDPIFGVAWTTDSVTTNESRRIVTIQSVRVENLRIAAEDAPFTNNDVKKALEICIPKLMPDLSLDAVLASLDRSDEEVQLAGEISNKAPRLIFRTRPSILVPIDGQPVVRQNKDWGVDVVVNSPATIVKDIDGRFYLYAGGNWYAAPAATGPYQYADKVERPLRKIARGLEKAAKRNGVAAGGAGAAWGGGAGGAAGAAGTKGRAPVYDIVVSTVPAELIQSDGVPDMRPLAGTAIRYAANSGDAILMDTTTKLYYVLLSGRWYRSDSLNAADRWQYVAADRLPPDFSRIPGNSPVGDVLPSVAGTQQAKDAVMDAQIPQLEKIDRKTATTQVVYDGEPEFESIEGTDMMYAVNTCSTVLSWRDRYYAVDDGAWFTATGPHGPWKVSTARPAEMDLVPPDCPVYNARYVDVYQVSRNYVYDGYTPGYLQSYIDNCTVVYGTGFDYLSWRGDYYYPRPWTWGFGMCYDPWWGWGFGMDCDVDFFDCGWGWDAGFGFVWGGGAWGVPGIYHPAYPVVRRGRHSRYERHGGYVAITSGQRGRQGRGLVGGRPATLAAGAVARSGYSRSRSGGYAGMRGGGYVGAHGGGYGGRGSGGGYSGRGWGGGGYGGVRSGGGGSGGGGGGHVGGSGGGGGGGGGGHAASSGGGGGSSGGGSGGAGASGGGSHH